MHNVCKHCSGPVFSRNARITVLRPIGCSRSCQGAFAALFEANGETRRSVFLKALQPSRDAFISGKWRDTSRPSQFSFCEIYCLPSRRCRRVSRPILRSILNVGIFFLLLLNTSVSRNYSRSRDCCIEGATLTLEKCRCREQRVDHFAGSRGFECLLRDCMLFKWKTIVECILAVQDEKDKSKYAYRAILLCSALSKLCAANFLRVLTWRNSFFAWNGRYEM